MYDPTPPLFDPLGEGVDVSDIDTSTGGATTGAAATHKGGYKAKVSTYRILYGSLYTRRRNLPKCLIKHTYPVQAKGRATKVTMPKPCEVHM